MTTRYIVAGPGSVNLEATLLRALRDSGARVVGLAVAYVSVYGVSFLSQAIQRTDVETVLLIADIGDAVTHPEALRRALDWEWNVRVVARPASTFHPKLIVGGRAYADLDRITGVRLAVIGSANLTKGGLRNNMECATIRRSDVDLEGPARAFERLWAVGNELTAEALNNYESAFESRNRLRSPRDLSVLGVSNDAIEEHINPAQIRGAITPAPPSISSAVATAAWAGLEVFTGEYRLQVEFPKNAGLVLQKILATEEHGNVVLLRCCDGGSREMRYQYYPNAMFRLNVPNDTPDVGWVRQNRTGIALIEVDANMRGTFRIVRPGPELDEIIGRSIALGTWGRTSRRLYGWY